MFGLIAARIMSMDHFGFRRARKDDGADMSFPLELLPVFENFITCEYASLTKAGAPITYPLTPYVGKRGTLDVSTGLTYPAKAERARRNPKVALLFSEARGSGVPNAPIVLVQGMAAVRDSDLQTNTDRYVRASYDKLPAVRFPYFITKNMNWYYTRMWIETMPKRILWWEGGDLTRAPHQWDAPADQVYPPSDSAPQGEQPAAWLDAPNNDWRAAAAYALANFSAPVLTWVDADGFPMMTRVMRVAPMALGFQLEANTALGTGKACLTFHKHGDVFSGQENMVFVGGVNAAGLFTVERQLADWSLKGSSLSKAFTFLSNGKKLRPRLIAEAQRRGQAVPVVKPVREIQP
jgi:hypothetical protein